MKLDIKAVLQKSIVVVLLLACSVLLFYKIDNQSLQWKKNVTVLSVNQERVEEEWNGISNRPAPKHSGIDISYGMNVDAVEPVNHDVHIWSTKRDTYMIQHRKKLEKSFSLYVDNYNEMKVLRAPEWENPEYEYGVEDGRGTSAQVGKNGEFWYITDILWNYEEKEKKPLPSIEEADKVCKKVLDFFDFSYRDNGFLKMQGAFEYDMGDEGVYRPKANVLFYERMVEGIPTFGNGYYFEQDQSGIVTFEYLTSQSAYFLIAEDSILGTIHPKDMTTPQDVRKRFEKTAKTSDATKVYKNYSVEDFYLTYSYRDIVENGEQFDEFAGKFIPGWILRAQLQKYDFDAESWSEENLYYFYPLDGTEEYLVDGYTWGGGFVAEEKQ